MSDDRRETVTCKNVQESLDVKVVCSKDNFEQHLLINGDKLLIPLANVSRPLPSLVL